MTSKLTRFLLTTAFLFFHQASYLTADAFAKEKSLAILEEQRTHLSSTDPKEVIEAIEKISLLGGNLGVRDLIQTLHGTPNFPLSMQNAPVIKFYAARALAYKGDVVAVPAIIKEFKDKSSALAERVQTKRKIQDPVFGSDSLASPYFFNPDDMSIVLACGEMLRTLAALPLTDESTKVIQEALKHKNFYIRASAADAIYLTNRIQLTTGLAEIISNEKDDFAKVAMTSALAGLEKLPNQNFKSLLTFLENSDGEIRKKASEGLVRMDLKLGATYLEKAIGRENDPRVLYQLKEDYRMITSFRVP
ncbi:MAG: hypothetical protein O9292_02500 [Rhodobacteraceae bacterium]|nr:hypothetical protein [Paracoccaceae bacterium]